MNKYFLIVSVFALTLTSYAQHKLPVLPYAYSALEPYMDSTTMFIHLNNHHAAYVNNLNKALEKYPDLQSKSIEVLLADLSKLPAEIQTSVRNNGGGHFNHLVFWNMLAPAGTAPMSDYVKSLLVANFGSVGEFMSKFEAAAASRFGSGWVWLLRDKSGKLFIETTANQDNTLMDLIAIKGKPVLALDVWEHAYYLKYQSKRLAFVKAYWQVVNWKEVERLVKE